MKKGPPPRDNFFRVDVENQKEKEKKTKICRILPYFKA